MPTALYLDTSAVLRATFESGTTPELEAKIRQAAVLITSRLSLVESALKPWHVYQETLT